MNPARTTPVGLRVMCALAICSGLLYLVATVYYVVETLTEGHVRPGDMSLGDGTGFVVAAVTAVLGLAAFGLAWSGTRMWRRGHRAEGVMLPALGIVLGLLPVWALILGPSG